MSKYARIDQRTTIEVVTQNPSTIFHPSVAATFISVPDEVVVGSTVDDDGVWSAPVTPDPAPEVTPAPPPTRELTPAEFILLFSPAELLAIKNSADPVINLYWEMIYEKDRIKSINANNPLLDQILGLFATDGVITSERATEIKAAAVALSRQV